MNWVKSSCDLTSFEMHMLLFKLLIFSFNEFIYGISCLVFQTQMNKLLCFKVIKKPNKVRMSVVLEDTNFCLNLLDLLRINFFVNLDNCLFKGFLMLSDNNMFDCIFRHLVPVCEFIVKLSILGPLRFHSILSYWLSIVWLNFRDIDFWSEWFFTGSTDATHYRHISRGLFFDCIIFNHGERFLWSCGWSTNIFAFFSFRLHTMDHILLFNFERSRCCFDFIEPDLMRVFIFEQQLHIFIKIGDLQRVKLSNTWLRWVLFDCDITKSKFHLRGQDVHFAMISLRELFLRLVDVELIARQWNPSDLVEAEGSFL